MDYNKFYTPNFGLLHYCNRVLQAHFPDATSGLVIPTFSFSWVSLLYRFSPIELLKQDPNFVPFFLMPYILQIFHVHTLLTIIRHIVQHNLFGNTSKLHSFADARKSFVHYHLAW